MQIGWNPDPSNVGWVQIGLGGLGVAVIGWFGGWLRGLYGGWELYKTRILTLEMDTNNLRTDVDKNEKNITETQRKFCCIIESLGQRNDIAAARQQVDMNELRVTVQRLVTVQQLREVMLEFTTALNPEMHRRPD